MSDSANNTATPGAEPPIGAVPPTGARPMTRRAALKFGMAGVGLAASAPLLAACGSSSTAAASSTSSSGGASVPAAVGSTTAAQNTGKKATVRLWTWYQEQKDEWGPLIDQFQAANPNITVTNRLFGTADQFLPALQAAVAGGDVPEIFAPHVLALQYGKNGISANLTKDLGGTFTGDFFDSANQEYTLDGKQYALGWMAQTFGVFYDPSALSKAGVTEPETWDDLIAAAPKLKSAGYAPLAFSNNPGTSGLDFFLPLITQAANDPTLVLQLDQSGKWNNPTVVKALEMLQKIYQGNVFQPGFNATDGNSAQQLFYTGKSALYFSGSWTPQGLIKNAPPAFVKQYKVMQTPAWAAGAKHWCANQAGAGLAVSETSPNKAAALEFIKFIYEGSRYAKIMNASTSMPCTKTAAGQVTDPTLKQMTSWLTSGLGCPHITFGQGSTSIADAMTNLLAGKGDPASTAVAMESAVSQARQ